MNIKKLAVDAAIQASAPTPPDTATDAGRVVLWQRRQLLHDKTDWWSEWGDCAVDDVGKHPEYQTWQYRSLVLASDLDAVTVELMEQCRIVGMGAERELALQAKLDAVTAELEREREQHEMSLEDAHDECGLLETQIKALMANNESVRRLLAASQKECERLREALRCYGMAAGMADQYRAEALAARASLGFAADSDEVSPDDIKQAIATRRALPDGCVAVPVGEVISLRRDAARFKHLQDLPAKEAQAYFWTYSSRTERKKAIDAAMLAARPAQAEDPQ